MDVIATMYCTSWLNLAKNGNVSDTVICNTVEKFSSKCFDFYNEAPRTERPNSVDEDNMVRFSLLTSTELLIEFQQIEAVNFSEVPCADIL